MAGKTSDEIFTNKLRGVRTFKAACFQSLVLLNKGDGTFSVQPLPGMLQWSSVFAFYVADFDGDCTQDIFAGGNFFGVTPYEGRYDALLPNIYTGNGSGGFNTTWPVPEYLAKIEGQVRDIKPIKIGKDKVLIVARNNLPLVFLKVLK
jgi:hypothetical protein